MKLDDLRRIAEAAAHRDNDFRDRVEFETTFSPQAVKLLLDIAIQLRAFREDWYVTPKPAMDALAKLEDAK